MKQKIVFGSAPIDGSKLEYPCWKVHTEGDGRKVIVLFKAPMYGVCIYDSNNADRSGEVSRSWAEADFKPYFGTFSIVRD